MKKIFFVIIIIFVVIAAASLGPLFRLRSIYNAVIDDVAPQPYSVVQMDDETKALLADAQANWFEFISEVDGAYSDGLDAFGLSPSVSNVISLLNYRPEHFFPTEADVVMGMAQALLLPPSIDQSIHLSADGQTALMRRQTNAVEVLENEDGKLRESVYMNINYKKSNHRIHSAAGSVRSE